MDNLDDEIIKEMKNESLRYVSDTSPGFFRQKNGNLFSYYDAQGKKITNSNTLERIKGLVIPPAWKNVWIAPISNSHLQATGIDDRGRKQYIYHEAWKKITQENKFSKMIDFGFSLPKIRSKIRHDLNNSIMDKKKIVATVIWFLEHTFIRIGNEEYQKENNSYGLTTLRNKHATVNGNEIIFRFRGKHGVENIIEIKNKEIAKTIKKCIELPGYELFQYIDDEGKRHVIDSEDINNFLKEVTDDDFTAKEYRTWGASSLASQIFYKLGDATDAKVLQKNIRSTVKEVSNHLNNTISICRKYYIHPAIIKTYSKSILIPYFSSHDKKPSDIKGLLWNEDALIRLLQKYS